MDELSNTEKKDNQSPTTNHKLVHVEGSLDKSEDETEDIVFNIVVLPNSSTLSRSKHCRYPLKTISW